MIKKNYCNKKLGKFFQTLLTILMVVLVSGCLKKDNTLPIEIVKIAVTNAPNKTEYILGENLDLEGIIITGTNNDGSKVTLGATDITNVDYDNKSAGKKVVTITVKKKTTTFNVIYKENELKKIEIITKPTKIEYFLGENVDLSGIVVKGTYADNTSKTLGIEELSLSTYDKTTQGNKNITINAGGKTATFTVNYLPISLEGIAITSQPNDREYYVGEDIDFTGLVVTGTYNNGTTKTLTDLSFSNYDKTTTGSKTITVTVDEKTATFTVTYLPILLEGIAITSQPNDREYYVGENIDFTGLVVTGTYNNGTTKTLTDLSFSNYDKTTTGTKTITVTVEGKTATFTISYKNHDVTRLQIVDTPDRTIFTVGETIDMTGLTVRALYSNNTTKILDASEYEVSNVDTSTSGYKTVIISSKSNPSQTASLGIRIVNNLIEGDFEYAVNSSNEVTIEGFWGDRNTTTFIIPDTINGKVVSAIGDNVISNFRSLTSITIPSSITSLDMYFLESCKNLDSITFENANTITSFDNRVSFFNLAERVTVNFLTKVDSSNRVLDFLNGVNGTANTYNGITYTYNFTIIN